MRITRAVLPVFAAVWLSAFPSPCPTAAPTGGFDDGPAAAAGHAHGDDQHRHQAGHPHHHHPADHAHHHQPAGHAHHQPADHRHHGDPGSGHDLHDGGDCPHGAIHEHEQCPHCGSSSAAERGASANHDACLILADMTSQGGYAVTVKWDLDPAPPLHGGADTTLHVDGRSPSPHPLAGDAVRAPPLRLHLRHCVFLN